VKVWNLLQKSEDTTALHVFNISIMPVNHLEFQSSDLFYHFLKQLLVKNGIIKSANVRGSTTIPDPISQRDIDEVIELLLI